MLGTDEIVDKASVEWWIEQVAVPSGDSLTDHAELLSNVDARGCVEDFQSTNVDSGSEKSMDKIVRESYRQESMVQSWCL